MRPIKPTLMIYTFINVFLTLILGILSPFNFSSNEAADSTAITAQQTPSISVVQKEDPDTVLIAGKETLVYYLKSLDRQPEYYPDGNTGMMNFLSANMKFSTSCYQPEGRVVAKCLITEEGKVERVEIFQSLAEYEDKEVVRLASMMTFKPALLNNHPVASWFFIPIKFKNKE